jgi:hypothetical protein
MNEIINTVFEKVFKEVYNLGPLYSENLDNFHEELGYFYLNKVPREVAERVFRRLHDIASEALDKLSFEDLHEVATIANTKKIWQMPAVLNESPKNRRRLHAHAMKHLVRDYIQRTYLN